MKFNKVSEECGVFGVALKSEEAVGVTYNALMALQHRGQEGAGIAAVNERRISCTKNLGLVSEVFGGGKLNKIPKSNLALGHTQYSMSGNNTRENVGPFIAEYLTGRIAVTHNGNITNADEIRDSLKRHGVQFNATNNSEVIAWLIAYCIMREENTNALSDRALGEISTTKARNALEGVVKAANFLCGAFSLIVATSKKKLIAVRDSNGFRPLCIGKNEDGYAFASESCALEVCGFEFIRDVLPGEVVVIDNGEITHEGVRLVRDDEHKGLCIFEFVYFARPDSVIDGVNVNQSRYNMGRVLATEHPVAADVVCGVPDSGLEAAVGYSKISGIPLAAGFVKNRYIGRSFIYPVQSQRDTAVLQKLNPLAANIRGKRVVLIDDSIVRGTTSAKIVRSLKNAGAREVHMRISSPPFKFVCNYGTDIDSADKLIANRMELDEVCQAIGADSLGFISVDGLKSACKGCSLPFCTTCFTGE
ncbi:MAG: amidophosphoribosyltransferase [Oscillospiraceae bacterium]|nr:amidophosphoribosyltransferase [Oscillospiraceae bacterium]